MMNMSGDGAKVKKSRRRLRLSCVECTKRRQKCDRNHPCSLCVLRGVPHLCRWETVPVARPAPARPPGIAINSTTGTATHDAIVQELSTRIANLERTLAEHNAKGRLGYTGSPVEINTPPHFEASDDASHVPRWLKTIGTSNHSRDISPTLSSTSSPPVDQMDIASTIAFPLTELVYQSTSTLAQLSLAHHGEFVGRGSLICALHSLTARTTPRFLYAKSTDPTFECRENMQRFSPLSYASHSIQELLSNLPQRTTFNSLTDSFFFHLNWRYGVSEEWFNKASAQMWSIIETSAFQGSEINANWLMLVFAILATAPRDDRLDFSLPLSRTKDDYFMCAMIARRIAEDDYFNTPRASTMVSPADGTVLGCLAIPLLASFLAERGRVSEAWKLVGNGVRNAQAVGLHRDPDWKLWQLMSEDEKSLRRRAWWGMFIADKSYSYILGRPHMIQRDTYDVALPSTTNEDGSVSTFNSAQVNMIRLVDLLAQAMDTCFNIDYPPCLTFIDMDAKFEQWESSFSADYRKFYNISEKYGSPEISKLGLQHYILHSWYLIGRVKIYLAATTGQHRATQISLDLGKCREMCIKLSMEVIQFQCDFHAVLVHRHQSQNFRNAFLASGWLFHGCFSLFEACVAIMATIPRLLFQQVTAGAMGSIDRALSVFTQVSSTECGKTSSTAVMAINVLNALRDQHFSTCRRAGEGTQIKRDDSSIKATNINTKSSSGKSLHVDQIHHVKAGAVDGRSNCTKPGYRHGPGLIASPSHSQYAMSAVHGIGD